MGTDEIQNIALKRSAMHNYWLKAYPDGGQVHEAGLWNQHSK